MTAVPVKKMTGALTASPFFNAFAPLQREIDRVFEDFVPSFWSGGGPVDVRCKMNLAETKDGLELTVELPGLEEKDVNVEVSDGVLTVSGEKKFESEQKDKNYHMVERGYGSFSRSIDLPAGVQGRPDQGRPRQGRADRDHPGRAEGPAEEDRGEGDRLASQPKGAPATSAHPPDRRALLPHPTSPRVRMGEPPFSWRKPR